MKKAASLTLVVAALALVLPSQVGAVDSFGLKVFHGEESQELATFKKAKCRKGRGKGAGTFFANATSTNGQYKLSVAFFDTFDGFHPYDLVLAKDADPVLRVYPVGAPNADFSNEYVPPFSVPGFGEIRFPRKGKEMRAGFAPVMWNRTASDGVVAVGGVDCIYPPKR